MAKKADKPRVIKMCTCGATKFQGPFPVGEMVVDESGGAQLEVQEELYLCRNCNRTQTVSDMLDHPVMTIAE